MLVLVIVFLLGHSHVVHCICVPVRFAFEVILLGCQASESHACHSCTPALQGVTYEAVLYLKPRQGPMWSDVLVAVDGQPAFTTDREMYAMVNATTTVTVMKKVEFRTGVLQVVHVNQLVL